MKNNNNNNDNNYNNNRKLFMVFPQYPNFLSSKHLFCYVRYRSSEERKNL